MIIAIAASRLSINERNTAVASHIRLYSYFVASPLESRSVSCVFPKREFRIFARRRFVRAFSPFSRFLYFGARARHRRINSCRRTGSAYPAPASSSNAVRPPLHRPRRRNSSNRRPSQPARQTRSTRTLMGGLRAGSPLTPPFSMPRWPRKWGYRPAHPCRRNLRTRRIRPSSWRATAISTKRW